MKRTYKYARAYLNVYGHDLSLDAINQIQSAITFLKEHRRALFLLQVPLIPLEVKREGLFEWRERFDLPISIHKLIDLLLESNDGSLIVEILEHVISLYQERNNIHMVTVSSSAPLFAGFGQHIEAFLADRIKGIIIYKYTIDKNLIAGIRLQSQTFLWEYSINKQLRALWRSREQ